MAKGRPGTFDLIRLKESRPAAFGQERRWTVAVFGESAVWMNADWDAANRSVRSVRRLANE
jgi:hypothetical protein